MAIRIALAGNPNCGKTTLFNNLTGSSQYVGNWPGVTVEKKEGKLKGNKDISVTDLPGIYSLSPYTLEEVITRDFLVNETPDVIINLVDASNIERNLYLTTQLLELGIPVVIALNMMDIVEKNGDKIDKEKLEKMLGCAAIVETTAVKGTGYKELIDAALAVAGKEVPEVPAIYSETVQKALHEIGGLVEGKIPEKFQRYYTVKLFEQDEKILESSDIDVTVKEQLSKLVSAYEENMEDDSESIITSERYDYITDVIGKCVRKKQSGLTVSDKIDRVVTNRIAALPIFVVIMFLVYFISVSTLGDFFTEWMEDGLFGDGWHLAGVGSSDFADAEEEFNEAEQIVEGYLEAAEEAGMDEEITEAMGAILDAEEDDFESEEEFEAFEELSDLVTQAFIEEAEAMGLTADIEVWDEDFEESEMVFVNAETFAEAIEMEEPDGGDYGIWIPGISAAVEDGLERIGAADWIIGLLVEGIIGGIGAVLTFVPQLLLLFLFLAILEDCGYMARVAFIMDRIFRKFGLSGKSFIPMLISSGCGVPGIMASRTIENEKDRKMTIMVTTFVPCGAKLPIIALFAGAIFGGSWWVAPCMYFMGIGVVIISGIILKKTRIFAGDPAPFVMELPQYHVPGAKGVLIHMWERGKAFIIKVGTIIFIACGLIWFLSSFSWSMEMVEQDASMLADIGRVIAPIFAPLGFGDWQSAVATVSGLVAKENVVGTMGVLQGMSMDVSENDPGLLAGIGGMFTSVSAMSFMVFNLLCAPCFAAIGAIKREMMGWKWTLIAIGYQTALAYVLAFIVYQIGAFFILETGSVIGLVLAFLAIAAFLYLIFRKDKYKNGGRLANASANA